MRKMAQLLENDICPGQDFGCLKSDPPRLATDEPVIECLRVSAATLEKVPMIADHRIEPFDVPGELGQSAHDLVTRTKSVRAPGVDHQGLR